MNRVFISACAAVILAAVLGGCANQNSIFRKNVVAAGDYPTVFTVDAKQRHMIVAKDAEGNWRTCAEAAPDVFSALSTSAAADLGFGRSGTQTDARAKAAIAIAEAAGTIERTQTINLLRESMYRTCERYLSGEIDRTASAVQAGRDWRAMIGILAIEQLTRAARPPATIIAAGSTSASVQDESEAMKQLAVAQEAEDEARIAKKSADDDLASTCGTITPDNEVACKPKQAVAASAKDALDRAIHRRETWETITRSYGKGPNSSASTGTGMNDPGGALSQGTPSPNPTDMSKVADTVGDIVHWAFDTDETQLFCIQVMQDHSKLDPDGQIRGECIKYLVAKVQTEQSLFAAPAVVAEAAIQSNVVQAMRTNVVQFLLLDLDEASYERDRAQIAAKAGSFCAGLPRDACIWAVGHGDFDPKAGRLLAVVKQLQQVRGQQ